MSDTSNLGAAALSRPTANSPASGPNGVAETITADINELGVAEADEVAIDVLLRNLMATVATLQTQVAANTTALAGLIRPVISTTTLPGATVNVAYTATLAASGSPTSWAVTSGSIPGLTLSTGGVLSGTPTAAGTYSLTVTATNTVGVSAAVTLSVTVSAAAAQSYMNSPNPFTSSWTLPLSSPTVAPGSAAVVAALAAQPAASGYSLGVNSDLPLFIVPSGQASVTVTANSGQTVGNTGGTLPIPASASSAVTNTGDSPLIIHQPSTGTLWESWQNYYASGAWKISDGVEQTGLASTVDFPSPYGLSSTGIPYRGTMITQQDIASGSINHVIALQASKLTYPYWPPANRNDAGVASIANQPSPGMWFTWASGTTMPSGLAPFAQMVWTAIQNYGCVILDTTQGGGVYFCTESYGTTYWQTCQGQTGTDPITTSFNGQASYQVVANLPLSSLVQIIPPALGATKGTPPGIATAVTVTPANSSLGVSWTAPASVGTLPGGGASSVLFYLVAYRVTGSGAAYSSSGMVTGTTATLSGLTAATSYDIVVYTANGTTLSAPTAVVTGTPTGSGTGGGSATVAQAGTFGSANATTYGAQGGGNYGTTTSTIPTLTSGRVLLAAVWSFNNNEAVTSNTVSGAGATWTKIPAASDDTPTSAGAPFVELWVGTGYSSALSSTTVTYTDNSSGSDFNILQLFELSGVPATYSALLDTAANGTLSPSANTPFGEPVTPSAQGNLIFSIAFNGANNQPLTTPSLANTGPAGTEQAAWQWGIASSASVVTPTWETSYGPVAVATVSFHHT